MAAVAKGTAKGVAPALRYAKHLNPGIARMSDMILGERRTMKILNTSWMARSPLRRHLPAMLCEYKYNSSVAQCVPAELLYSFVSL